MNLISKVYNVIGLPVRLVFSHETVNRLGLRSLRDERYDIVRKNLKGRLIDLGCGNNELAKTYGNDSLGVDVFDFGGDALIVEDTSSLPFENGTFQSASFVASLNHVIKREKVLNEVNRILSNDGIVLITMISPFWGVLRHKLAWWDSDQNDRGMEEGEEMGLSYKYLIALFDGAGFQLMKRQRFILGINNLYIFQKAR